MGEGKEGKKGLIGRGSSDGRRQQARPDGREQRRCSAALAPKAAAVLGLPQGRKYVSITGEKAVELVTARSGDKLRMARRKGDWGGREVRCGGQQARGRLRTADDAAGSGGIVEVGGCRSAPLSKQRGEKESEREGGSPPVKKKWSGGGGGGRNPADGRTRDAAAVGHMAWA
jgi:hypothetical protein